MELELKQVEPLPRKIPSNVLLAACSPPRRPAQLNTLVPPVKDNPLQSARDVMPSIITDSTFGISSLTHTDNDLQLH